MSDIPVRDATEEQWHAERVRTKRFAMLSAVLGFLLVPALGLVAILIANATADGSARYPSIALWLFILFTPGTAWMVRANMKQHDKSDAIVAALAQQSAQAAQEANRSAAQREEQARRQEFESRLGNALEMAEDEAEVIDVIEHAITTVLPTHPAELLLADNSHAHLLRMAHVSPTGEPPGCTVTSPDHCPAARRAQTQQFASSEQLDACPKLRGRPGDAVSAVCVPVSIMGRTVGVLHTTGPADEQLPTTKVQKLGVLANLAGSRIGMLRVMAEAQVQASTDSLTGLLNRRSFEAKLVAARSKDPVLTLAMVDLDHFKRLNDTFGHETGDRALRLFADVLRSSFRSDDLVCRYGGEEFVVAFPGCLSGPAHAAVQAMAQRLDAALTVAGLPRFTISAGLIEAHRGEPVAVALTRADNALFAAKRGGRDQVVVHDADGEAIVTAETAVAAERLPLTKR